MRMRAIIASLVLLTSCLGCSRQKSTDALIADLKSASEKDRLIAVRLLPQRTGDESKVVPALVEALDDQEADVRISAAIGLGQLGPAAKDAIPKLEPLQSDPNARLREAARVALSRIAPDKFSKAK